MIFDEWPVRKEDFSHIQKEVKILMKKFLRLVRATKMVESLPSRRKSIGTIISSPWVFFKNIFLNRVQL